MTYLRQDLVLRHPQRVALLVRGVPTSEEAAKTDEAINLTPTSASEELAQPVAQYVRR